MKLTEIPLGSKCCIISPGCPIIYGYVDVIDGFTCFITHRFKVRQDVSGLFLKYFDPPYDIAPFLIDHFFHVQPSLPFQQN